MQCSPFQPGLHSHFPSLQVPCSLQRGWHALWSHPLPIQPSSQRQLPDTQTPWPPQSAAQISVGDRDIEKDKKESGGDGQKARKGVGGGMEREDKVVTGQGDKGEKKTNPRVIVKERRPRSTTLSDGSWKEIPAPHKGQSFLTIQI